MAEETNDTMGTSPNEVLEKRVYVGGLHESVTEDLVRDRFKKFGNISQVTIAKNAVGQCRGFGHITLQTTPKQWTTCLSAYNGSMWKGSKLKLEDAKPDFVERQRMTDEAYEKIEKKRRKRVKWASQSDGHLSKDMSLVTDKNMEGRQGWKRGRYGRAIAVMCLTRPNGTRLVFDPSHYKNNLTKLRGTTLDVSESKSSTTANDGLSMSSKDMDNQKRLMAMDRMEDERRSRQQAIKKSLEALADKTHTLFDDSDDERKSGATGMEIDDDQEDNVEMPGNGIASRDAPRGLFDSDSDDAGEHEDDDDDDDLAIRINPVLEGKGGRERLALQSRFKGDERFRLGEDFIDEEDEKDTGPASTDNAPGDDVSTELNAQKHQSLDILRSMFGDEKGVPQRHVAEWTSGARFDPEADDAANYLVEQTDAKEDASALSEAKSMPDTTLFARQKGSVAPKVSTEKHFTVNVNLKPLFQSDQDAPFKLFGGDDDESMEPMEDKGAENEERKDEVFPNMDPSIGDTHVGLQMMFFVHVDDLELKKRSCYAYDRKGIFQYAQDQRNDIERRWRAQRHQINAPPKNTQNAQQHRHPSRHQRAQVDAAN